MALALTVRGVSVLPWLAPGSLHLEDVLSARSVLEFALRGAAGSVPLIRAGDPVLCSMDGTAVFGGTVDEGSGARLAYPSDTQVAWVQVQVACTDWNQLCDRLIVARAYRDTDAETILRSLWATYLEPEGVTLGALAGLGVTVAQAVFNYLPLTDCLEALAERTGCHWQISPARVLSMTTRDQVAAPWGLSGTAPVFDVQVRRHRDGYRNRQYITGARAETSEQEEFFSGDAVRRTFTVGYPIVREPTIERNGVAQTVGLKSTGARTDAEWLWTENDPVITQGHENAVIGWPALGAGSSDYDGLYLEEGEFGGKPAYTNGVRWLYWATAAAAWCLGEEPTNHVSGSQAAYYGDGANLPANDWAKGTGSNPAPVLGDEEVVLIVTGAGSGGFNGTYYAAGAHGGKTLYGISRTAGPWVYFVPAHNRWLMDTAVVDYASPSQAAYYTNTWVTAWKRGTGDSPAPTSGMSTEVGPRVQVNSSLEPEESLTVRYIGAYDLVLRMDRSEQVAARAAVEGGTGLYMAATSLPGLWDIGSLVGRLEDELRRFGALGTDLAFGTYTPGLAAGQLLAVSLPEHNFTGDALITEARLQELVPAYEGQEATYAWQILAVTGEALGGWASFFRRWDRPAAIGNLLEGAPETVIGTTDVFVKVWQRDERPNPFFRLYPATDLHPDTDVYPQFAPRYEVRYLAVFDGVANEVFRKPITSLYRYTADEIGTITVLGPDEYEGEITHLGWYGGDGASATPGSGILLEQVAYAATKTALEGILFNRRDLRGWGGPAMDLKALVSGGEWVDEDDGDFPVLAVLSPEWATVEE